MLWKKINYILHLNWLCEGEPGVAQLVRNSFIDNWWLSCSFSWSIPDCECPVWLRCPWVQLKNKNSLMSVCENNANCFVCLKKKKHLREQVFHKDGSLNLLSHLKRLNISLVKLFKWWFNTNEQCYAYILLHFQCLSTLNPAFVCVAFIPWNMIVLDSHSVPMFNAMQKVACSPRQGVVEVKGNECVAHQAFMLEAEG